jgi:transketolase
VAIHAKTIKGYGTKKTAESSSGAHGFPLKDPAELRAFITEIYAGEPVPEEFWQWADAMVDEHQKKTAAKAASASTRQLTAEKVQVGISRAMIRMREQGHPVVSISSDLPGSTGVAEFQKKFPEVTQDVGVAEANMVSTAIGLSKEGFIPVVDTFSQFGVTKGGLPLIMAALSQGPMICVFSHAGFQDAADGASHQALSYIAMVSSIPYTDVYVLTSSSEADALMEQAIQRFAEARRKGEVPHSVIFFLGRENFPPSYMADGHIYRMGEAQVVFDNTAQLPGKVTIVAAGPMLHEALQAAYTLENEKLGCVVVNPSVINKPDLNTIRSCLRNTDAKLLTVEDHQVVGGMGSILIHALTMAGIPFRAQSLGVKGEFGQSAYKASELYRRHGIDALAIAAEARKLASL